MPLIVEDGTGLSTAQSYVSVADADAYHTLYGNPTVWTALTTTQKEGHLRLATRYLDLTYGGMWTGQRSLRDQALDWPRHGTPDRDGYLPAVNSVPQQIKDACSIMALMSASDELIPNIDNPGTIKKTATKVGEISEFIEYQGGRSQIKRYRIVDLLVAEFLCGGTDVVRS